MHIRFANLVNLNVPHWVIQPFSADPADLKVELHNQFITLQNDDEFKMNFEEDRYDISWSKASGKYPLRWNELRAWVLSFLRGFSNHDLLRRKRVFSRDAIAIKTKISSFH